MGSAALVATAIALVLLLITAYVIVGGTLATAQVVSLAQDDKVDRQETRIHTSISITGTALSDTNPELYVLVENTGSETITDLAHMDVLLISRAEPVYYPSGSGSGTWSVVEIIPDQVHPGALDPDEVMNISVRYVSPDSPFWVKVITPNGVYDSSYI
ncbi:MAG: hypothetical protein RQ758_02680 [Methanomicrobiaceae archaeon]|nr:hypothetical protein [Methanomicrobiaceae archaeon]